MMSDIENNYLGLSRLTELDRSDDSVAQISPEIETDHFGGNLVITIQDVLKRDKTSHSGMKPLTLLKVYGEVKYSILQNSSLSSGNKQLKDFMKSLKLPGFISLLYPQVCISSTHG